SSNDVDGIYLDSSNYNTISDNTASSNSEDGISLDFSNNNTISDNTASSNYYGIFLRYSNYNTISNNTASSNDVDGIYLDSSNYNTISDNNASSNSEDGIYLDFSNYNTISDNNASSNYYGIFLRYSNYNTISNNTAIFNSYYGIYLSFSSSNNTIYNNLFNNTNNFGFVDTIYNDWNTTKTLGTNIIGGPYLGGNFWAYPNGTGFSETCPDADSDGICDSYYNLTSGNIDWLPLTVFTLDTTSPAITLHSPQNTTYGTSTVFLNVSADESVDTWWYSLDGSGNVTFTPNISLTGLLDGPHVLTVYANDTSGNLNSSSVYFTVDTIPPTVNLTYLSNGTTINIFNDWLYGTALDLTTSVDWVNITLNGIFQGTFPVNSTTGTFGVRLSYLPDAWNNITLVVIDRAGNNATVSLQVYVRSNFSSVTETATANETLIINETLNNTDAAFEIITTTNLTFTLNVTAFSNESDLGLVPFTNASVYGFRANETAIGKFILIETSDNINVTTGNISRVGMKLYLKREDLDLDGDGIYNGTGDVNISALRLYWYNESSGTWHPLEPGADYEIEGPFVHDSGIDTGSQPNDYIVHVWAELSHFSVYGIGSTVYGVQASVYGMGGSISTVAAAETSHSISIHDIVIPDTIPPGSTLKLAVKIVSKTYETGAVLRVLDLPVGWNATEIQTGPLYPGPNTKTITLLIPEGAQGEFTLTVEAVAKDFYGTARKAVTLLVGKVEEVGEEVSKSVETPKPTAAPKPPVTEKPAETPAATMKPEAPEPTPAERKGICGPSLVAALALVPVLFRRKRQ
ncbi:MAG: CGP-CTERM sorting domain-containing protein, partial [Euryarchaeota archaeon]|nr:CGP-CTERM sorting domain-containing protein [Euryarchaeota archaeon]